MLPTLFLSHGAPYLPIVASPARDFLRQLGTLFERPKAILVVSAHWETPEPMVSAVAKNSTIHDFRGFPQELYELQYPAPGSPELASRVATLLAEAGLPAKTDFNRGLDHGAWVPLILAYPDADIPVVQLSVQTHLGPEHHLRVGRALEALRAEGVLIVASGSFTHNLREFFHANEEIEEEPRWVTSFADWFDHALTENRVDDLLNYREIAPQAARNHPTEEHLLPLYAALGAAGEAAAAERLHSSADRGIVRLDAYAFSKPGMGA